MTAPQPNPNMKMPKWLLYGLIAKGVFVVAVTVGVLWWAGGVQVNNGGSHA